MKSIVILFVFFVGISIIPAIYAQETVAANHDMLTVTVTKEGDVSVMHEIKRDPINTVILKTLDGTVEELQAAYKNGDEVTFDFNENMISIVGPSDAVIISYVLKDFLVQVDGYWTIDTLYRNTIRFNLPQEIELTFVNGTPLLLGGDAINCHGCNVKIEYLFDEPWMSETVSWEEKTFDVDLNTLSTISSFVFDQPSKRISFDVEEKKYVTMKIPLELLWEPYEVFLNEKKILKHEFHNDGTNVWLSFKPESSGTVDIIGTSVIPEFPVFIPLAIGITMIVALQFRNKITLR